MAYFKIDSEERAEEVSRMMYSIMNPGNMETLYLFGWRTDDNGQPYIDVPLDMECPVFVNENFDAVVKSVGELLGIPQEEGQQLRQYLEGGKVVLGNLMPSSLEPHTPYFKPPPF